MKIKIFNKINSQLVREGQATVRINTKTGIISFSKMTCKNLGLKDKTRILFVQDEENPKDWYIVVTKSDEGMICKHRIRKDQNYEATTVQSTYICREIAKSCNIEVISFSFLIAATPTTEHNMDMYAIITDSVNTLIRKK